MFLKLMILHVGCVEVLRPALHGQLFKGRRTSCNGYNVVILPIPLISPKIFLMTKLKRSSYILVGEKASTAGGGYFTVYSKGFLFKVSVTPEYKLNPNLA